MWPNAAQENGNDRVDKPLCLLVLSCFSCVWPTPCDLTDSSPPGSSVHGITPARILEWVAMPSSRGSSPFRDRTCVSCIASRFFPAEPLGKHYIHTIWLYLYEITRKDIRRHWQQNSSHLRLALRNDCKMACRIFFEVVEISKTGVC